ncbi:MAG: hypothetical protein HRU06_12440 [Oceanospirillaceae bacterium]|nr:hypothetical protein [Oceanospirillaceae bacterium]
MEIAEFFNSTLSDINHWYAGEQPVPLSGDVKWWVLAAATFLLGCGIGYYRRAKTLRAPVDNIPAKQPATNASNSYAYLQMLLAETKIVIERYQTELGVVLENSSVDDNLKLEAAISAEDLHIYYTAIDDLKNLENSALRLQIVKANTLFKLTLHRFKYYRELHCEYEGLTQIAAKSQIPLDSNRVAQSRLKLQRERKRLRQDHLVMITQMRQMFTMIRSHQTCPSQTSNSVESID